VRIVGWRRIITALYRASFGWAWWPGPAYGPYYWRPALVGFFGWAAEWASALDLDSGIWVGCRWLPSKFSIRGTAGILRRIRRSGRGERERGRRVPQRAIPQRGFEHARGRVWAGRSQRRQYGAAGGCRSGESGRSARATAGDASRESTQFSNRAASTEGMPRTSENTRFASHMQTSQSNRMSFDQQQRGMSQGMSRAAGTGGMGSQAVHINPSIVQNRGAGAAGQPQPAREAA